MARAAELPAEGVSIARRRRGVARRAASVEAFAARVTVRAFLVVFVGVEFLALHRLVDLPVRRQGITLDETRRIPKVRSQERLRALRVRLFDVDEDPETRRFL